MVSTAAVAAATAAVAGLGPRGPLAWVAAGRGGGFWAGEFVTERGFIGTRKHRPRILQLEDMTGCQLLVASQM